MTLSYAGLEFASPALRRLVRSPWTASYGGSLETIAGLIAPDAHVEFVFQTGSPCAVIAGSAARSAASPRAMIFAQRHGAVRLAPTGANAIIAFRTLPAVASAILGRSLADCWDRPVDLGELIGPEADFLAERIAVAPFPSRAALLESWLVSRLTGWGPDDLSNLQLQRRLIWGSGGESLSALAEAMGFTQRTLRRRCARHAGLSPKQLSMSGRILQACTLLGDHRGVPIAEVALHAGFGDQAAFTNAFRHYVGITPGRLRAEPIVYCERPNP